MHTFLKLISINIKSILIAGASLLTIFSFDTYKYNEGDQLKAFSDLEVFVDSIEIAAEMNLLPDWSITYKQFGELESNAQEVNNELGVEDIEIIALEGRYQNALADAKQEAENFDRSADLHMTIVKEWWDNKSGEMK